MAKEFLTLGSNALGSRAKTVSLASCTDVAVSCEFWQFLHVQSGPQKPELAKHGQYSLRHFEALQLHLVLCCCVTIGVNGVPGKTGTARRGTATEGLTSSLTENC